MPASYKGIFLSIFILGYYQTVLAQALASFPLKVGDTLPKYYLKTLLKLSVEQNKNSSNSPELLILHFWDGTCKGSQKIIPSLDSLQYKFGSKFQLVLVAPDKKEKVMQSFNEIHFKSDRSVIISEDSIYKNFFPYLTVPHHVWINSKGKVLYITEDFNATAKNIQSVLEGFKLNLIAKQDDSSYSMEKPLWNKIETISHPVLRYSSTLTLLLPGISSGMVKIWDTTSAVAGIRLINQDLLSLYKVAFTGTRNEIDMDNRIILNVTNPEFFKLPEDKSLWNDWLPHNIYNYELYIPIKESKKLYNQMQEDLSRYFGYVGKIENRLVKCLVLIENGEVIKSKGGPSFKTKKNGTFSIQNLPVSTLYKSIKYANSNFPLPIINGSGEQKIDFEIKESLTNIVYLRKELQKIGLDLVEKERNIQMLIIHEMKNQ